jgi:gamma-glutamyltranspeptidase
MQAIAYPRIFYFAKKLHIENPQVSDSTIKPLITMGYDIKAYDNLNGWFGRVQAIFLSPADKMIGVSDPRDYGAAMGL